MGYLSTLLTTDRADVATRFEGLAVGYFDTDYAELVAELRTAALDWERATDVNFIHRPQFDDDDSEGTAVTGDT